MNGENAHKIKITMETELVNELKYVDWDIREEFVGKQYFIGLPTIVQLNRNLDFLIERLDILINHTVQ